MSSTSSLPSPSARWQRVKEVFHEALTLEGPARAGFLEQACAGDGGLEQEVLSLLEAHDQAAGFLDQAAVDLRGTGGLIGREIGPYTLKSLLGEGGMGAVYLATREMDGFAMPVALKLIRWGAFTESVARRFRLERQILARLQHPNITRLIDGGVTADGLPFLVTEYIEGKPLDVYLAERNVSRAERLRLFLSICSAVAEAHRNLIVHGDLKPNNVLVTPEGHVKLLDFGISRLLQDEERTVTLGATVPAMTPGWASPEQLRGESPLIASDCYSLGRILYFLLTGTPAIATSGRTPHDLLDELSRSEPTAPSRAASDTSLAGDLDNIVLKALECSPDERYRNVELLAEDIRAYLESRPVSARSHTWRYRTTKFIGRNRVVVAASIAVSLALLTGVVATLWQARIARRNYERAERRFADVRRLANSFLFEMDESIARLPGSTSVRGTLVRNAVQYLDSLATESESDDSLQEELAAAYEKIGNIQGRPASANLGDTGGALANYRKAITIREALLNRATDPLIRSRRQEALATAYVLISGAVKSSGDFTAGLDFDKKALLIRQQLLAANPGSRPHRQAVASSFTTLGGSLSQMGAWEGVIEVRQRALEMYSDLAATPDASDADHRGLALAHLRMASILSHEGRQAASLEHYRTALAITLAVHARNPANSADIQSLAFAHTHLGLGLSRGGDYPAALAQIGEGSRLYEQLTALDPREVRSRSLLASNRIYKVKCLAALGKYAEAIDLAHRALADRERLSAENPVNSGAFGEVAEAHETIGDVHWAARDFPAALTEYRRAREMFLYLKSERKFNAADREALERIEARLAAPLAPLTAARRAP